MLVKPTTDVSISFRCAKNAASFSPWNLSDKAANVKKTPGADPFVNI
jgi:hypothetical protein